MMRVVTYEFSTKEMKDIILLHLATAGATLGKGKVTFGQIQRQDEFLYVLEIREDK